MLKRAVLLKLSWPVPPSLHMFSKVQRWTPFQKSIFAELSQKIHLIKCHIHSQLIEKLEHITMLLKFSTFRYNNVNRASKTKIGELCHSIMSNTIYFNWRSCRDRIFLRVGGKTHKNYFHKKYFHSLRTDIFPRNTFHILYVPRK